MVTARHQAEGIRAQADALQASIRGNGNGHAPAAPFADPQPTTNAGDHPKVDSPPVTAAPVPQPPPPAPAAAQPPPQPAPPAQPAEQVDWKAKYEEERERNQAQAENWRRMRSNMQAAENAKRDLEARMAQIAANGPPPTSEYGGPEFKVPGWTPPQAPQQAPPQQPQQAPVQPTPDVVEQARRALEQELGVETVRNNEALVQAVAGQMAQTAASQAVAQVMARIDAQIQPTLSYLQNTVQQQQHRDAQNENRRFHEALVNAGHPDWQQVLADPDFQAFVRAHPYGVQIYGDLYPEPRQPSGTAKVHASVMDEFKRSRPGYQAAQAQAADIEQRRAAVAESAQMPLSGSAVDAGADTEQILLSSVEGEMRRFLSKPQELIAFRNKIEKAQREGRIINDLTQTGYSLPVVP